MSLINDVKKLEASEIALWVSGFLATISPGFLMLYLFKPELVSSLDVVKLIIFSAALGLPIFAVNLFIDAQFPWKKSIGEEEEVALLTILVAIHTILASYGALLTASLFHLSFHWFLGALGGLDIVTLFIMRLIERFTGAA
jgi:hypothetical protein